MRTISFTETSKRLRAVLDRVNDADCAVITRRDAPEAVVISSARTTC